MFTCFQENSEGINEISMYWFFWICFIKYNNRAVKCPAICGTFSAKNIVPQDSISMSRGTFFSFQNVLPMSRICGTLTGHFTILCRAPARDIFFFQSASRVAWLLLLAPRLGGLDGARAAACALACLHCSCLLLAFLVIIRICMAVRRIIPRCWCVPRSHSMAPAAGELLAV